MNRLLIIEDEAVVARMYEKIFNYAGFTVEIAGDGEDGLAKVKNTNPDLILLDIMMPKMDGLKVLDILKKDEFTKNIPVVVLTNLGNDAVVTEAFRLGATGYIFKSGMSNDRIVEEVKQYLAPPKDQVPQG
ncbi:hypothetical protein A3F07_04255 [candidate division WWE3 bacterium RIFCSPHIGHO2_12_FULL_38_15]|uniref:Response regulatory domain-containing protein n=1 Tax=candidate division WWE3 bacterium RIFCSPHIGHO2_02_FULL_38_14 TaxID=1802620 RepID=A0A1F4V7Y5_UNCKA|nr:MAG: hypothetical protein A2793_02435 [candidate division WWE3 bacterium RIFCSPHIGHO2_01_FULL_38_45]OGC48508.1 MAG: hypothetical protein A3F07_04255 [candidate division WWE3 bacterium RIFCSPHIGHO2_12_FULL_38_15]OGC53331.1 MAG: hypothetical protein A3D91_02895 [candidate division WWE3 bacterium RIFCSPHIGHO2_02_FULL_38_14]OGC53857.1 MAG: hypothetical protein A3B64_00770 [candidate division WWE3 bacterium RIFCSPLOWO2_01_FULL_37_24]HLB51845.1 response regulator [Patescibacteria group bacterium]